MPIRPTRMLGIMLAFVLATVTGLILADRYRERGCSVRVPPGSIMNVPGERMRVLDPDPAASEDALLLDVVRDPVSDSSYALTAADGHVHPFQEEAFRVVEGRALFLIGDRQVIRAAGEQAIVPAGVVHHWMALDDEPVRVVAQFAPSLDTAAWFASFSDAVASGEMSLVRAAVISSEFSEGAPLPASVPGPLWNALVAVLAPVGRVVGHSPC